MLLDFLQSRVGAVETKLVADVEEYLFLIKFVHGEGKNQRQIQCS